MACFASTWANELSEKQAQELAKSFVNSHFNRKGGGSDLKSQGQVKGLGFYVFNMTEKGGFVIVSNESRSRPIIGFSETGKFDADNMPDNMRAWLQGYADEIAWLKKQPTVETGTIAKKLRTRSGSHATNPIEPLVKTHWDQRAPYNNLCPEYTSGKRAVTGCVATAMAQVMKFHNYPSASKNIIPGYTTDSYQIELSDLPVTTFDWEHMNEPYTGNEEETDVAAKAVAKLMQYCGYSVEMDYGPSSGASSAKIATALKDYFDYNSTTTTLVTRSFYTNDKWADLIYHELSNGRPVVYGGQSSGGGHEFVCDGYKYEDGTDYFHINWGWGGHNDEYYLLSVLNPYGEQGAGGSSSDDGFHYGQDAVIGVQKSTENGAIADITPNVINLTLNSMTLSHSSAVVGQEVTVTLNITNNNANDYYGDICIGYYNSGFYSILVGEMFSIPARSTRDCVMKFTPTGYGTYNLVLFLPNTSGSYSTDGTIWATLPVVQSNSGIPTNLVVTDISSTGATLSWTENGEATSWKVGYKADGVANFTTVDAPTNPFTLTGLTSETEYTVKVRPANSEDAWSSEITFTTCATYPVPENLAVSEVTPTSAVISWTGSADSYDVRYGELSNGVGVEAKWLQYDDGNHVTNYGFGFDETTWGVMYPGSMVSGNKLTKVSLFLSSIYNTDDITVRVYSGGNSSPGTQLYSGKFTPPSEIYNFLEISFDLPIIITPGQNLWITLTEAGSNPVTCCQTSTKIPNNQWIFNRNNNNWVKASDTYSNFDNYGWMIRGYIESESLDNLSWTATVNNHTGKSYQITGMNSTGNYVAQVRSNYGSNHSDWVTASITKALELGNNDSDNENLINAWNNQETTVTLKDRTLYKDGSWNTLCLPFSLNATQLAASPLADADIRTLTEATFSGGTLTLNFTLKDAITSITAGTPYIIKWTKADGYESANAQTRDLKNPVFNNVTIDNTARDITSGKVTFKGTYIPINFSQVDESVLFLGDNNYLYFPQSGAKINACRAYFELDGITASEVAKARIFIEGGNATEIVNTNFEPVTSNVWYTIDGRKFSGKPVRKGVYVQNGKKVVIK